MSNEQNQEAAQTDDVTTQATPETTQEAPKVENPEAVLAKNKELLGELKAAKKALGEFEALKAKEAEEKLAEEGKYKELLEAKEKKISELSSLEEKASKYDDYFGKELEKAVEQLGETQKALIEKYNGDASEKLVMAQALLDESGKSARKEPVVSGRAGGSGSAYASPELNPDKYSSKQLQDMKYEEPEKYKLIMGKK